MGLMSFYDPARRGYIPCIVGQNELAVANIIDGVVSGTLIQLPIFTISNLLTIKKTWSTMMAVGSAIGGFITASIGSMMIKRRINLITNDWILIKAQMHALLLTLLAISWQLFVS